MWMRISRVFVLFFGLMLMQSLSAQAPKLSFQQAVQKAYRCNPDLQAQIAKAHAQKGSWIQSQQYLNPALKLNAENIGGQGDFKGWDSAETTLSLTQPIPLGGKWQYQQKVEYANYLSMLASIARKKSQIFNDVGQAYINVIYAKEWYETSKLLIKLNKDIVTNTKKRVRSGASKKLDLAFAELDLINQEIFLTKSIRDVNRTQGKLAQFLGEETHVRYTLDENTVPHITYEWSAIKRRLLNSIFIKEKRLQAQANRLSINLAKKNIWPTLAIQVGGRHFNSDGSKAMVVSATSNIPLFNRNQGTIVEAEANYTQSLKNLYAEQLSLEQRLYARYLEAKQRSNEARIVKTKLLPLAKQAQHMALKGYELGSHTFADLTLAMQRLIREQRHYIGAHTDVDRANIAIQGLLMNPEK